MPARTLILVAATATILAAACSTSLTVAEVNGEPITAAEVGVLNADTSDAPTIDGDQFRDDLGLLIVNTAIRTTAEEQFGITGVTDADRLADRIANPPEEQANVFAAIAADPQLTDEFAEGAAQYFLIRDAVLAEIAGDEPDELGRLNRWNEWFSETLEAAEIEVISQVGFWAGLGQGVLPPP